MIRVNLNDYVKFKLNDYGKEIYYHKDDDFNKYLKSQGRKLFKPTFPEVDSEGFTKFQLWKFIEIYGSYCGMGFPAFWDEFNFYIDDYEEIEEGETSK